MPINNVNFGYSAPVSTYANTEKKDDVAAHNENTGSAAKKEDTILIKTTVGLQGRAIINKFTDLITGTAKLKIDKCHNCLKNCSLGHTELQYAT